MLSTRNKISFWFKIIIRMKKFAIRAALSTIHWNSNILIQYLLPLSTNMQIYSKVLCVNILGGSALPSSHYSMSSFVIWGHYTFNRGLPSKASSKKTVWLGFIFYLNAFTKIFFTTRSINLHAKHSRHTPINIQKNNALPTICIF